MVKSWTPHSGAPYRAVFRIHYFGNKREALEHWVKRQPLLAERALAGRSEDFDNVLELRKDCRYLNLPDFNLFEVRLNKNNPDCVELWFREIHHGDDDLQKELIPLYEDIGACRYEYFKNKDISQIMLFFIRPHFADIAPNWRPVWSVRGATADDSLEEYSTLSRSPDVHEPGPSIYTRSSTPSRLSDASADAQASLFLQQVASTPVPSPSRLRKPSIVHTPTAAKSASDRARTVNGARSSPSPVDVSRPHVADEPHPESWIAVRPHLEEALKPLFDAVPQARPPSTAAPFVMYRAIKTALNLQAERQRQKDSHNHQSTPRIPQTPSATATSDARIKELEAALDAERRARQEAEMQCKSAESDLEVLRESHAQAEEKLADLLTEMKQPSITPSLFQAFLGVHSMAREVFE